jgi:hypothetical protein
MNKLEFSITPAELLREVGWEYSKKGKWLLMKHCPFCGGGDHADKFTFIVHEQDGNFTCSRSKCGNSGSFWKLLELHGQDPRNFLDKSKKQTKKKKWMYKA